MSNKNNDDSNLFRYRPISLNSMHEISTSSFYASNPADFNDPFDCDFSWKVNSEDEMKSHINFCGNKSNMTELDESKSAFELQISNDIKELGVTCFTSDPLSPLMWSHYADGHRGICIEYKRIGVLKSENLDKVKYIKNLKSEWVSLDIGKDIERLHDFIKSVVYTKLPEWKYEKEWRLMLLRPQERLIYVNDSLLSVTFGLNCSKYDVEKVFNLFRVQFLSGLLKFYNIRRSSNGDLERIEIKSEKND